VTGATGVLAATAPLSYNSGTQTVSVPTNAITAANIANRTRRVAFTSNQFITQTVSQFNLASQPAAGARTIRNNFFSANDFATGTLTLAFVVPPDYSGVSSGNLATNLGIQALGLRIKWATVYTQANGSRKINMDISFSQDDQLATGLLNRFRCSVLVNSIGINSAEALDPSNIQIAEQIVPEAAETWDTAEGAVNI